MKIGQRPVTSDQNRKQNTEEERKINNTNKMGFFHLFIINRSGGLIHHRPLGPRAPRIGTNEWLRIGSTFHSIHAIAAEASPVRFPGNINPGK